MAGLATVGRVDVAPHFHLQVLKSGPVISLEQIVRIWLRDGSE